MIPTLRNRSPRLAIPEVDRAAALRKGAASEVLEGGTSSDIQGAIDSLTSGRTWQEKIKLIGSFVLNDTVAVDGYTWVDASEASFVYASAMNKDGFRNRHWNGVDPDAEDPFITWEGGILDGNKANQTASADDPLSGDPVALMNWKRVPHFTMMHTVLHDSVGMGYRLTGRYSGSEKTRSHTLSSIETYDNARRGHSIQNATRHSNFFDLRSQGDCVDHNATDGGVWIGHSEGTYHGVYVRDSGAAGVYINNVRHIQASGVQVMDSWFHGIHVIGYVESSMYYQATGSSGAAANTYSDLFFDNVADLSYGPTKRCIFDGYAGLNNTESNDPLNQSAKAGIEFKDDGVDTATTGTANQDVILRGMVFKGGGSSTDIILPAETRMKTIDDSQLIRQSQVGRGDAVVSKSTQLRRPGYWSTATLSSNEDIQAHQGLVTIATTGGNKTAKLPSVSNAGAGHMVMVRKSAAANTATISPQTGEKIDNVIDDTVVLSTQDSYALFICNGDDGWEVVAPGTGSVGPAGPAGPGVDGITSATDVDNTGASSVQLHACDVTTGWEYNNLRSAGTVTISTAIKNEGTGSATFDLKCNDDTSKAYIDLGSSLDKSPYRWLLIDLYVEALDITGPGSPWQTPLTAEQTPCYLEVSPNTDLSSATTSVRVPNILFEEWATDMPFKIAVNTAVRTIGFRSGGSGNTDGYRFYVDNIRLRAYTPLEYAMETGDSVIIPADYAPSQTQGLLVL